MNKLTKLIIAMLTLTAWSCTDENVPELDIIEEYEYVSLPETVNLNELTDEECQIALSTLPRFKMFINNDGLFEMTVKSAKEINVSQNIYDFIIGIMENSNEERLRRCGSKRESEISRNSNTDIRTDCVAVAIHKATGIDEKQINGYITTEYGDDGVPFGNVYEAILHYHEATLAVAPSFFVSGEPLNEKVIIVYKCGANSAHAVNGMRVADHSDTDGKVFVTKDYQAHKNGMVGFASEEDILGIFVCE